MKLTPRDYLTEGEAAEALGTSTETLQSWVADGTFPSREIEGRVVVPLGALRRWHEDLLGRMRVALDAPVPSVAEVLPGDCGVSLLEAGLSTVLKALVGVVAEHGGLTDTDRVLAATVAHARSYPAAPGVGIGTPHVRHPEVVGVHMAVAHVSKPIEEYVDPEGRPTQVVLLLMASPAERSRYTALLSRLAHELAGVGLRDALLAASSAREVQATLVARIWGEADR